MEAAREYRRVAERDRGEIAALRRAAAADLARGAVTDAAASVQSHAERLVSRGWKLTGIVRYRELLSLAEKLPAAEREPYRGVQLELERLRVELATRRRPLAAHDEAARALERNGDDADVVELSRKMVAVEPDNPVFQARLAEALCRQECVDDAIPAFRAAAEALVELGRASDALRVVERILHFRVEPDDALLAATLYLDRGEPNDAARAVSKLAPCLADDPESLDALLQLARAFDAMDQPTRAAQVRVEMARIAHEAGEMELHREIVRALDEAGAADATMRALVETESRRGTSAPELSYRNSFVSVIDQDLVRAEPTADAEQSRSEASVLDEIAFEDISEVWLMPVMTKEARRALDEAETFTRLRLFSKAEAVLRAAVDEDPVCAELREALRQLLERAGDRDGFVAETLELAELYLQRRFFGRSRALVSEALTACPGSAPARALAAKLESAPDEGH